MLLLGGLLHAQTPHLVLRVEQVVDEDELVLDFYLTQTAGSSLTLSTSNFSVRLTAAHLDLAGAYVDAEGDGPWDADANAEDYRQLQLGRRDDYVTLNINSNRHSAAAGAGTPVPSGAVRVGRVRVPITNPAGFNTLVWRVEPIAITDWDDRKLNAYCEFINPEPDFPLCAIPGVPSINGPSSLQACADEGLTLEASSDYAVQWYRDGQAIPGATSSSYMPNESGLYQALALNYSCESGLSAGVAVSLLPASAPEITEDDGWLVSSMGGPLQWYKNGEAIAGATASRLELQGPGTYTVVLTNDCGTFTSNPYLYEAIGPIPADYTLTLSPNPFREEGKVVFGLPDGGDVRVELLSMDGQTVSLLANGPYKAGTHTVELEPSVIQLPQGSYLLRLVAGQTQRSLRVLHSH